MTIKLNKMIHTMWSMVCEAIFNILELSNAFQKQIIIVLYFIYLKYENIIIRQLKGKSNKGKC